MEKRAWIADEHPRWDAGNGRESGEFKDNGRDGAGAHATAGPGGSPVDGLSASNIMLGELERRLARRAARALLRARLIAVLRGMSGIIADGVPVAGEIYDAYELAMIVKDFEELHIDANAAIAFVKDGPRVLETLQVGTGEEGFSSYGAFLKLTTQEDLEKRFGPAGDGFDYHHIVEQGGANGAKISPDLLQNTDNIVRIPKYLHEEVTAEYMKPFAEGETMSLRAWLRDKPYEVQRARGLEIMRKLGIIQ